jgi:hypothetical protein
MEGNGWKGDSGDGQVLGEATRAYSGGRSAHCNSLALQYFIY